MSVPAIISADDHLDTWALPQDLFQKRLPAQYREQGPRVIQTPEGAVWSSEGQPWPSPNFSGRRSGNPVPTALVRAGIEDDGFRPSNPQLRLKDMDMDGILAQVIYGPLYGFPIKSIDLKIATIRAYNDWGLEFNSVAPARLCMLPVLPVHSPQAAAEELRRCAPMGHRGTVVSPFETGIAIFEQGWESFWAAAEEVALPISFHLGGGTWCLKSLLGTWRTPAYATVVPMQMDEALVGMIFSGTLERHPKLKLVLAEAGLGWVPYVVERMDYEFDKYRDTIKDVRLAMRPKEVFHRQVMVTFEEEPLGPQVIPMIGANNVMWASDFPHPDSTFPHSRKAVEEAFRGLPEETRRKAVCDNAAGLYRIPVPEAKAGRR